MTTEQLRAQLTDRAFGAGWSVIPRLPRPLAAAVFDRVAAWSARRPGSYEQLRRNLRQVTGGMLSEHALDALVERGAASYARYWREAFQLPSMSAAEVVRRTEFLGFEHVTGPREQGRGVVIALTHSGNWDAAAVVLCKGHGVPMTTVAERLRPESLFERFVRYRESLGMSVAPLSGGAEPSVAVLKRALKAGETITLLADRDLLGSGIEVELCGRRTTMPSGPALMAIQTGAALVPLELSFTPTGWRNRFHPEIAIPADGRLRERVTAATEALAAQFTDQLRRTPQDWHMLQKIWPDT